MISDNDHVMITGAAGLIGSRLCRLILDQSTAKVICLDNGSIGNSRIEDDRVIWIDADVTSENLWTVFDSHSITHLVHLAAHPGSKSVREPSLDVLVNAYGSTRIFEWCARNDVPIIYLSSSVVYGEKENVQIRESEDVDPGTIYGVCKIANENSLRILERAYGLKWTVLRVFATYGVGHNPSTTQGIVNVMLTQLLSGNPIVVKGALERVKDMIHVDDTAAAIAHCINNPVTLNTVLNVGTGNGVSVQELISKLCLELGKNYADLDIVVEEATVGDTMFNIANIDRLIRSGFNPQTSLDEGLKKFVRNRKR